MVVASPRIDNQCINVSLEEILPQSILIMLFSFHICRSLSCNLQLPEEHLSGHVALHASSKNKGAEFQCSLETYETVLLTTSH